MPSFFKRSIEVKIIAAVVIILAIIISLSEAVDLWVTTSGTYEVVFSQLESLANTIQKSLIKDMREGKSADVQQILEMVGTEKGILGIRIFDENGKVLKSKSKDEINFQVSPEILKAFKNGKYEFVTAQDGYKVLHIVHPIANAPPCYGCHGREREINGVLSLDYSLQPIQSFIGYHNLRMVVLLLVTVLSIGAMIYLLMKRLVGVPLKGLKAAMGEAEKGNLEICIPVQSADEIGSLQASFNSMIGRINELHKKNCAQERDLMIKGQELTVQRLLAERNRALESANEEITEKNRYYLEMLSFISHELKNPMVILQGYSDLLLKGDLGELQPAQMDAVGSMEKSVDHINEMIANYLDLARIERGQLKAEKRKIDLVGEVINPGVSEFKMTVQNASMTVKVYAPENPVIVEADPALLLSAFGNLLSNASKYGWPGTEIAVEIEPSGGEVKVSVTNEGNGIPYNDLERVFERFTRLDNEQTHSRKGSGLGLCIVKEIIELHGGKAWAESLEGSWARVAFTLPAAGAEEKAR